MTPLILVVHRPLRVRSGLRAFGCIVLVALAAVSYSRAIAQQSTSPITNQGRQITLRDQLTKGLLATTKADFEFIDKVVVLVDQGKLPRRLVDGTFLWARERAVRRGPRRALRPMVYFRPALIARAERLGLEI